MLSSVRYASPEQHKTTYVVVPFPRAQAQSACEADYVRRKIKQAHLLLSQKILWGFVKQGWFDVACTGC